MMGESNMSEPAQTVAGEPQPKPKHSRAQLFAMAGERRYLIDKLSLELQAVYAELDKEQPTYPPKTEAPALAAEPEKAPDPVSG